MCVAFLTFLPTHTISAETAFIPDHLEYKTRQVFTREAFIISVAVLRSWIGKVFRSGSWGIK